MQPGLSMTSACEQFVDRGKAGRLEARRQDQLGQRLPNTRIVIDNDDERLFRFTPPLR